MLPSRIRHIRYALRIAVFVLAFSALLVNLASAVATPEVILKVEPGNQPTPGIAPKSARGIVFTRVNLTAIGGDVSIKSFTIMRTGGGRDGAFSSVGIEDIGDSGDLNAEHQYTVKAPFTIPQGETIEIELKGNMKSSLTTYQGDTPTLSLIAIETTARIDGTLPITGAAHTINSGLSLGSITLALGPHNPPSGDVAVKEKNIIFGSVRITIGSAEDIKLKNMYWIPAGSADDGDIINPTGVLLYRDKVWEFPANIYFDGDGTKKYRIKLDQKVTLGKGDFAEMYIKGDIGDGVGRTIKINPDKLNGIGTVYGYEVRDTTTKTSGILTIVPAIFQISPAITSETYQGRVNLGTVTLDVSGEVADIKNITFLMSQETPKQVTLWDSDGNIIAGPTDGSRYRVTLLSTAKSWEVPTGRTSYTITSFARDTFLVASVDARGKNSTLPLRINR